MPVSPRRFQPHKQGCGCPACKRAAQTLTLSAGSRVRPEADALDAGVVLDADQILEAPGRSCRDRVASWIQLRHQEPSLTNSEIAKRIGITAGTLSAHITKARREGWLQMTDPLARIEYDIIPQTLDNIAFYLSKEGGRDKQVTLETAKATIYKQYQESKGISDAPQTVLALKIDMGDPDGPQLKAVAGSIVGAPRGLSAPTTVVDAEEV